MDVYREKTSGWKNYYFVFADDQFKVKGSPASADRPLAEEWMAPWHSDGVLTPPREPLEARHVKWLFAGSAFCLLVVGVQLLCRGFFADGFQVTVYILAGILGIVGLGLGMLGVQTQLRVRREAVQSAIVEGAGPERQ